MILRPNNVDKCIAVLNKKHLELIQQINITKTFYDKYKHADPTIEIPLCDTFSSSDPKRITYLQNRLKEDCSLIDIRAQTECAFETSPKLLNAQQLYYYILIANDFKNDFRDISEKLKILYNSLNSTFNLGYIQMGPPTEALINLKLSNYKCHIFPEINGTNLNVFIKQLKIIEFVNHTKTTNEKLKYIQKWQEFAQQKAKSYEDKITRLAIPLLIEKTIAEVQKIMEDSAKDKHNITIEKFKALGLLQEQTDDIAQKLTNDYDRTPQEAMHKCMYFLRLFLSKVFHMPTILNDLNLRISQDTKKILKHYFTMNLITKPTNQNKISLS